MKSSGPHSYKSCSNGGVSSNGSISPRSMESTSTISTSMSRLPDDASGRENKAIGRTHEFTRKASSVSVGSISSFSTSSKLSRESKQSSGSRSRSGKERNLKTYSSYFPSDAQRSSVFNSPPKVGVAKINSKVEMNRLGSFGSFGHTKTGSSEHWLANASDVYDSNEADLCDMTQNDGFATDDGIDILDSPKNSRIVFNEFSIKLKNSKKVLMHPITTTLPCESMFGILGGSGSGKTTLLNAIAGRYDRQRLEFSGSLSFEGMSRCVIGYIPQDDVFFPYLTVRETIQFVARMRSQRSFRCHLPCGGVPECEKLTQELIMNLGLKDCADLRIASSSKENGPSGGELRRLSIAVQLISEPDILCADELTSGLDSFTAQYVVETLKEVVTSTGLKAALCTLHQPRADIFNMFDSILLICKGHPTYCGKTSQMISYFESMGHCCPRHCNPADYFIDMMSISSDDDGAFADTARINKLIRKYSDVNNASAARLSGTPVIPRQRELPAPLTYGISSRHITRIIGRHDNMFDDTNDIAPWLYQVLWLTSRFFISRRRNLKKLIGNCVQAGVLGVIISLIFWQLGDSYEDLTSRAGLMYVLLSLGPYLHMIALIKELTEELKFFDRERLDHMYTHSAFFTAQILASSPGLVLHTLHYSLPVYLGSNLRTNWEAGWIYFAANVSVSFGMLGIAWFSTACHRSFSVSSIIANMQFTFFSLASGFVVNTQTMPLYVRWISTISFLTYSYDILMANEVSNRRFTSCTVIEPSADCIDVEYSGNDYLNLLGIRKDAHLTEWKHLLPIVTVYYVLAFALLLCVRPTTNKYSEQQQSKSLTDSTVTALANTAGTQSSITSQLSLYDSKLDISVNDVCLYKATRVRSPSASKRNITFQHILKHVTCKIHSGRLVAIMGGSGSGKTSLLNVICQRIRRPFKSDVSLTHWLSTFFQDRVYGTGTVTFNGVSLPKSKLRHTIGYVVQFDRHMPSLTVYETFLFHAHMHLDNSLSLEEKQSIIYSVADSLGLVGCLNTYIGGNGVKGISGGELKRVSIGCELLLDPVVCLLDEPTTGLDSFTASRIIKVLRRLAHEEGKAVALTIHQPRYDIYDKFDDIILLSKGEVVWSGSRRRLLEHLNDLGYPCPKYYNPADFILEMSSIDLTNEKQEKKTRRRLKRLVKAYNKVVTVDDKIGRRENTGIDEYEFDEIHDKSIVYTLPLLVQRAYKNMLRQKSICADRIVHALSLTLIWCLFYAPLQHSQESIQNRIGCLYELTALGFVGVLTSISTFPDQREVFYREYKQGGYSAFAFFVTYILQGLPFVVILGFIISALVCYVVELQDTEVTYWHMVLTVICYILCGEAIGIASFTIFSNIGVAIDMLSCTLAIFCTLAGFISLNMPLVLRYISYISPMRWGSVLLTNYVFNGETFDCEVEPCPYTEGEEIVKAYGMTFEQNGNGDRRFTIGMLCIITAAYILLAFTLFRFKASMM